MASEFTRKSILNECLYNGVYAPSTESTPQIYSPSSNFLSSKTRMTDQQNARNYDKIMQRIRAGDRRLPSSRVQAPDVTGAPCGLQVPDLTGDSAMRRAHSLSPNSASVFQQLAVDQYGCSTGVGVSTPNLSRQAQAPVPAPVPAYSNLHSRHQEFLRRRRQDNALLSLGLDQYQNQDHLHSQSPTPTVIPSAPAAEGVGLATVDMNPAVAPYAFTGTVVRPTYAVRNVPVRNIDEVRETIGIRRQYYKDRLFGRQDGEGEQEPETQAEGEPTVATEDGIDQELETVANGDLNLNAADAESKLEDGLKSAD